MCSIFAWLADFFNKHYRDFFEKQCGIEVNIYFSDDKLEFRFKPPFGQMDYAIEVRSDEIVATKNGKPIEVGLGILTFRKTADGAMRAFRALVDRAIGEAICRSLYQTGMFTHFSLSPEAQTIFLTGENERYLITPKVSDGEVTFLIYKENGLIFLCKRELIGEITMAVREFRPHGLAKSLALLLL